MPGRGLVGNFYTVINNEKERVNKYGMPKAEYATFCKNMETRISKFLETGKLSENDADMLRKHMELSEDE
jgi:hypothetical protein